MKKIDVTQPYAMTSPFADGVFSSVSTSDFEIPADTSTAPDDTCVIDDGFLPITSTDLDDGGIAPERKNFNGMFYLSTDQRFFLQNGGVITYNSNVATAIGGYPQDAVLGFIDGQGIYKLVRSLIDDNTNDFTQDETLIDGEHWEEIAMGGGGSGYQMFDIVMKDHVLSYEETLGLAPLGTYVYKEAIAGTRYGYPDFYQKMVDEYNASSSIDETFEQPVLTANGTMGGSSFAVEASSYCSSPDRNAYKSFDGNNATKWGVDNTTSGWLTFYNPQALKVSSIVYTPSTDFPGEDGGYLEISGSNDNSTWTSLWTGSYTANSIQTFNVDSQAYYNYYRITITNGVSNWVGLGDLTINATYLADYVENSNKHRFYDIADKATFDNMYAITGEAWYYGIDTTNERIFLPRSTRFKNGTSSDVGEYNPAGLPNITGGFGANVFGTTYGAFDYTNTIKGNSTGANTEQGQATFDASRSSSIYGASTTVEYASTKLIPYMVVGNVAQHSSTIDVVDVTTTENDTLPLFTGMYFDYDPNNVSWVIAGGQVVSGTIYEFAYNELVNELTTPKYNLNVIDVDDMVVGTDYSTYWKVDQTNQTFTCPIRTSERVLVAKKEATALDSTWYNLYSDGWCEQGGITSGGYTYETINLIKQYLSTKYDVVAFNATTATLSSQVNYALVVDNKTIDSFRIINSNTVTTQPNEWQTSGYTTVPDITDYTEPLRLYFKVANAVQNLELLDAGAVMQAVNDLIPDNSSTIAGYAMPSGTYDDLTLGASGTTYTAPANGWFCLYRIPAVGYSNIENLTTGFMTESRNTVNGAGNGVWASVRKNDIIKLTYDGGTNVTQWRFYYAEGSESEAN